MSFLERFKGRTNQLTREGIIHTVTNASTPISKKVEAHRSQSFLSTHKENHILASPKSKYSPVKQNDLEVECIEALSPSMNKKSLRLRTSDEHYIFPEGSKAPTESLLFDRKMNGQYYFPNAPHPKNRELIQTFSAPRSKNFFRSINEVPTNADTSIMSGVQSPNYGRSNTFAASDKANNLKIKSLFNFSANYPSPYENPQYIMSPSDKNFEGESRVSKFSLICSRS